MTTEKESAALERLIADSCQPEKVRRACSLRLSRLRRAGASTPQRMGAAPMATPPAAPSPKQCVEAGEAFLALTRQRSALHRKRRTPAEQEIFCTMAALMPPAIPTSADPNEWRDFVAKVEAVLSEIKNSNL